VLWQAKSCDFYEIFEIDIDTIEKEFAEVSIDFLRPFLKYRSTKSQRENVNYFTFKNIKFTK
jgi:hypothetical protein